MILIDSNIPMYVVGAPHPNKARAVAALERCVTQRERLVTDAEVLQEILHRYAAIGRRDAIQPAMDVILRIVDEVLPVDAGSVGRAKEIVLGNRRLSARDAIHLAIMERAKVRRVLSFDSGLDGFPGIERIES